MAAAMLGTLSDADWGVEKMVMKDKAYAKISVEHVEVQRLKRRDI